jgi:GNAT superfamily N-acetyltransferase
MNNSSHSISISSFEIQLWRIFHFKCIRILREGLKRCLGFSWQTAVLVERVLDQKHISDAQPKLKVSVKKGNVFDLKIASQYIPKSWGTEFKERLRQGKAWLYVYEGGRFVGSAWYTFKDEHETVTGIMHSLNKNEAYVYNTYIVPEFRKLGIHTFLLNEQLRRVRKEGTVRVFGIISSENIASRKSFYKAGYSDVKKYHILRYWKWSHVFEFIIKN